MGLSVEQHFHLNRNGHGQFPPFRGGPATALPYTSPRWRQPGRTPRPLPSGYEARGTVRARNPLCHRQLCAWWAHDLGPASFTT